MQQTTKLFHQKLTELGHLTQQYTSLSQENRSVNDLNSFLNNYNQEIDENLDGSLNFERGSNGTVSIKQTALGPAKVYTVAANDYPIAIADKLGITINQLAKLQVPWLTKILGLNKVGQFDYRKLVGNSRKSRNSQYWLKGFARDWIIHPNDELLAAVPHPQVTKKAIIKANKKEEDLPSGINFFVTNSPLVEEQGKNGNPAEHINVTGLFKLLKRGKAMPVIKKVTKSLQIALKVLEECIKHQPPSKSKDVKETPIGSFNPSLLKMYNKGISDVIQINAQLSDLEQTDERLAQALRKKLNETLAKNINLPPLGHPLYDLNGKKARYVPSLKYKTPPRFILTDSTGGFPEHFDDDEQTIYYEVGANEMVTVGMVNLEKR